MEQRRKKRKTHNEPGHAHELTFSCYKRRPLLDDDHARRIFLDSLDKACKRWEFQVWAYVLMPEHVHLLICPTNETYSVPQILKAIKQPVSQKLIAEWRRSDPAMLQTLRSGIKNGRPLYQFWQPGGGYDQNMFSYDAIWTVIDYIHMNPVRRGLVESPIDWRWSSLANYEGRDNAEFKVDLCQVRE